MLQTYNSWGDKEIEQTECVCITPPRNGKKITYIYQLYKSILSYFGRIRNDLELINSIFRNKPWINPNDPFLNPHDLNRH
ncbi:hypothetical protein GCM10007887_43520 [Methylobacterium haplocladii]|nr:hypothetical protein GCM10007887_43520 [Methylobacterium haplocladii]